MAGCLELLLLLCLSASYAAPDPMSYGGQRQQKISQFASDLAIALTSDPWEENLAGEEQAFDKDEEKIGKEEMEEEAMFASETDEALIDTLIAQIEYLNKYDKRVYKTCKKGEGFYRVRSNFHWFYNDRRWDFKCRNVVQNNSSVTCTKTWTYVNDYTKPFMFSCGDNEYMAGVESDHNNLKEDRRWKFTCCSAPRHTTSDCRLSGNANKIKKYLNFQARTGEVITGVDGRNFNTKAQDRIWKYRVCKYNYSPPQFAPPLAVGDILLRTFTLSVDGDRNLMLKTQDNMTTSISLTNGAISLTSEDNALAYRPNYPEGKSDDLAGIFINIDKIFPCIANTQYDPICSIFTSEEGGFRKGKQFIQFGDDGYNVSVFRKGDATYGLAVSGCSQLNKECLPSGSASTVVCLLPRISCQTK